MTGTIQIAANTALIPVQVGEIVGPPRNGNGVWGRGDGLPNFIRVTVSDATVKQLFPYTKQIINVLKNDNPQIVNDKKEVRIYVDPELAGKFDDPKLLRNNLANYFVQDWGAEIKNKKAREMRLAFPTNVSLVDVRKELNDKFTESLVRKRYYFTNAFVQNVAERPEGKITVTRAELAPYIIDRRA